MTYLELRLSRAETLAPKDVAEVLGCKPYSINIQARDNPAALGFPVMRIGKRVRIPRRAFLKWLDGQSIQTAAENVNGGDARND